MRTLTVFQPWASLLACGAKQFETRSWATNYRGPTAIHAGMKNPYEALISLSMKQAIAMARSLKLSIGEYMYTELCNLPRGCVIATAELVGCWEIRACTSSYSTGYGYVSIGADGGIIISPNGNEMLFGDWTPGRYAWEFANMKMLPEPIPAKGKQRIWEWEADHGQN